MSEIKSALINSKIESPLLTLKGACAALQQMIYEPSFFDGLTQSKTVALEHLLSEVIDAQEKAQRIVDGLFGEGGDTGKTP